MMEQEQSWKDVKEIWENSSKGAKINFQVSALINELKGKVSQFEKDTIKKDLGFFTNLIKKLVPKFKSKNE